MRAPKIFVIVGANVEPGTLKAWYFDEGEANAACRKLCDEHSDEWAYKVEDCDPPEGRPEPSEWR